MQMRSEALPPAALVDYRVFRGHGGTVGGTTDRNNTQKAKDNQNVPFHVNLPVII